MKKALILLMVASMASCQVCRECETTYYDVNGQPIQTVEEEICGTNKEVKQSEGTHYEDGVKKTIKCR